MMVSLYVRLTDVPLTSHIFNVQLCQHQVLLQLPLGEVKECLHPVYLFLHQTAATRLLLIKTRWVRTRTIH